ncbi:MFS transporter [Thermogemmatispora carboxidivorans]|uniref:MFS transporter n=1 Tax=Thermogemmatispora carboxidivorans TaxID=1382306 RepID=UPI00069A807A|nr:MFS transporter [Thermogemmatispora carboxidivorans]
MHFFPFERRSSAPWRIFAACSTLLILTVQYTNYSPLIPELQATLQISAGEAGLFSTLLFLGLTLAYLPAGVLIDRYGARPVLLASTLLATGGALLLPLIPYFGWLLAMRLVTGLGIGGAFVAGASVAAGTERLAALGQGLYGGSTQVGAGLGLLLTPYLARLLGWRGAFFCWGLPGLLGAAIWLLVDVEERRPLRQGGLRDGLRSGAVWSLGLAHMGTFGLGNAIATWIALYLVQVDHLPLTLAATWGSLALLSGMLFRPLGGLVLGRRWLGSITLLRLMALLCSAGVICLALPWHSALLSGIGITLTAIGSSAPYAATFNEAASLPSVGKGVAQSLVSVISSPTVIMGPPLIGFLLDQTASYSDAFGTMLLFSAVAILAALAAGPAIAREQQSAYYPATDPIQATVTISNEPSPSPRSSE